MAPSVSLSVAQRTALEALVDTFIPALSDSECEAVLALYPQRFGADPAARAATAHVLRTAGSTFGVARALEELLMKGPVSLYMRTRVSFSCARSPVTR